MYIRCSVIFLFFYFSQTTSSCTEKTDCLEYSVLNGSTTSLVQCVSSECVCSSECFQLNLTSKRCFLRTSQCYSYSLSEDICHSTAPSWLTTFLLSLLIGTTGADNFYISRFDYAIPQLLLFLSPLCGCCTLISYCICTMVISTKRNLRSLSTCIHLMALSLSIIAAIVFPLMTVSWNLVDLVLFALNYRHDGNNCILDTEV
eukprot:TRINITY_DN2229_c0_g1_i3.p1 TRINITY_DN2229_c0_g1~~TRINITY_DN2229_c0_g1_i3.p1  ORF type:complete len:202 (+),score=18.59 TRINITY_DN2229_c0_g1_i3:53-658(+)